MAQESAFEFVARLQKDDRFRREYLSAKGNCSAPSFLAEMGYKFNTEELMAARRKLGFSEENREMVKDLRDELREISIKADPDQIVAAFCGCEVVYGKALKGCE